MPEAQRIALKTPGVRGTLAFTGLNGATFTNAPNAGTMFMDLLPKAERGTAEQVLKDLSARFGDHGRQRLRNPAAASARHRHKRRLQDDDRGPLGAGYQALEKVASRMMTEANQTPGPARAFTTFNTRTPRLYADIDRERAERMGVPVDGVFSTLGTYLGSTYINDFNFLGRTYRVTAQADAPYRDNISDVERLRTRSDRARWCRWLRS